MWQESQTARCPYTRPSSVTRSGVASARPGSSNHADGGATGPPAATRESVDVFAAEARARIFFASHSATAAAAFAAVFALTRGPPGFAVTVPPRAHRFTVFTADAIARDSVIPFAIRWSAIRRMYFGRPPTSSTQL